MLKLETERLATSPIRVTGIEDLESLRPRAEEWNALVRGNATNTVFQTFEWQLAWWRAFGADVRPLVLLAESEEGLVGVAPLMLSRKPLLRRRRRMVEFLGGDAADYCDFIVAHDDVLPQLLGWLVRYAGLWDVLNLGNLADTSPLVHLLPRFFEQCGFRTDQRVLYECPTRVFGDATEDRKILNKKSFKRHCNYFRRTGRLEYRKCTSVEEIEHYLDTFFDQHVRRWAADGSTSMFLDPRQRDFYRQLTELLLPPGWLSFSVLLFDDRPIAFHFGFEYHDRFYWIKPTFDPDHSDHAPGMVLLKHALEDTLERGVAEFDFTVGEEDYKYRFANHTRLAYSARVYRHPLAYHVDRLLLATRSFGKRLQARLHGRGDGSRAADAASAASHPDAA